MRNQQVDRSLPFLFPSHRKRRNHHCPPYHPYVHHPLPLEFRRELPAKCVYKYLKTLCVMCFHWKGGKQIPPSQAPRCNGDDVVTHRIVLGDNCFTVDNQPPRSLYGSANKQFLESLMNKQCPKELEPTDMDEIHYFEFGKIGYLKDVSLRQAEEWGLPSSSCGGSNSDMKDDA